VGFPLQGIFFTLSLHKRGVVMVDSFLKYLQYQKRYSLQTIQSYRTDLTQFEEFLTREFEGTPSQDANYGLVRSWIVNLVEQKLDALSVNRKIACLRSYYKFLLREELITRDPMTKIKILKQKRNYPTL
jgi:integrase/recombinase XerC